MVVKSNPVSFGALQTLSLEMVSVFIPLPEIPLDGSEVFIHPSHVIALGLGAPPKNAGLL